MPRTKGSQIELRTRLPEPDTAVEGQQCKWRQLIGTAAMVLIERIPDSRTRFLHRRGYPEHTHGPVLVRAVASGIHRGGEPHPGRSGTERRPDLAHTILGLPGDRGVGGPRRGPDLKP